MSHAFKERVSNLFTGMTLGHQMGQWSERRWWSFSPVDSKDFEGELSVDGLILGDRLQTLIVDPPAITTPGWGPTGFSDHVPHVLGLMEAYGDKGALTPEDFRDFMLASRSWLLPQGGARSCVELMAEGMNPRIAGLHAPSIVSGCWLAWPVAVYHAGNPGDAYEDAVSLCRALSGGDIVELTGAYAAAVSVALVPGSDWAVTRQALLKKLKMRNEKAYGLVMESLEFGKNAVDAEALVAALRDRDFFGKASLYNGLDWMQSFYAALALWEYAKGFGLDWAAFMKLALELSDSRFCAMLAAGLYGALKGCDFCTPWEDALKKVHGEKREKALGAAMASVEAKLSREQLVADEIESLAGQGDVARSRLYDRMLAGLLSGTVANAMGSPVEDRDYPWIVEHHGVVNKVLDARRFDTEDDAAMGLMWADTLIKQGGRIVSEDLADTFLERMNPNNFYYDTQHAFHLLKNGVPPHVCGHWNVVTGSALMGCNVIGMYHVADMERARSEGLELSYHYQRGFDVHAAAILCAATAEALRDNATVDSVIEAAIEAAPAGPQPCFDEPISRDARALFRKMIADLEGQTDVLAARQAIYDSYYAYNGQDPWEVIAYTLAIFKVANGDVWQSALGGTNIGRDSDTIACQATLLSACLTGMIGVPEYILSLYDEKTLNRYKGIAAGVTNLVREKAAGVRANAKALGLVKGR